MAVVPGNKFSRRMVTFQIGTGNIQVIICLRPGAKYDLMVMILKIFKCYILAKFNVSEKTIAGIFCDSCVQFCNGFYFLMIRRYAGAYQAGTLEPGQGTR